MYSAIVLAALVATVAAQVDQRTTPVPILRQINSHNDDGSYTYGFEAADGSYKIETKAATGEVRGKYGYVDSDGKTREVEYGANRNGFNPSGTDIQVPPPVIRTSTNDDYEDDGQYRPGPGEASFQQQQPLRQRATPSRLSLSRSLNNQAPVQQAQYYQQQPQYQQQQPQYQQQQPQYQQQQPQYQQQQPQYQQQAAAPQQPSYQEDDGQYRPSEHDEGQYRPGPGEGSYQQYQQQPARQQPIQQSQHVFNGHPARNIDLNSGSYSIQY